MHVDEYVHDVLTINVFQSMFLRSYTVAVPLWTSSEYFQPTYTNTIPRSTSGVISDFAWGGQVPQPQNYILNGICYKDKPCSRTFILHNGFNTSNITWDGTGREMAEPNLEIVAPMVYAT